MKNYRVIDGISFSDKTPIEVCGILANSARTGKRLKIYLGDSETGRDWMEEMDKVGRIGKSTGEIKIPLLIKTDRSLGGGAVLDDCIVKIEDTQNGYVLYQHPNYHQPKIEIVPTDIPENYSYNLLINGEIYSRHKTLRSAKLLKSKLS